GSTNDTELVGMEIRSKGSTQANARRSKLEIVQHMGRRVVRTASRCKPRLLLPLLQPRTILRLHRLSKWGTRAQESGSTQTPAYTTVQARGGMEAQSRGNT